MSTWDDNTVVDLVARLPMVEMVDVEAAERGEFDATQEEVRDE